MPSSRHYELRRRHLTALAVYRLLSGCAEVPVVAGLTSTDIALESGGTHLSQVLLDRLGAGIRVNIIYDSFGSRDTPPTFFDTLRHGGANIIGFNPLDPLATHTSWSPNDRDHRKIAVIEGRIGFTGGVNLDLAYYNPASAGIPADGNARRAY